MADSVVKKLLIQFDADTSKGVQSVKDLNDETDKSSDFFSNALGALTGFVGGTAIIGAVSGAWDFLTEQVGDFISAGKDAETTESQTESVLQSTGDASGMTAKSISDLAHKYMLLTGTQADTIEQAEDVMLTFGNISSKTMPEATQAALDLSQRFGIDLPSAAKLLGKALSDPSTGMSELARYTGQLSAAQQASIKQFMAQGDVADAQQVILDALAKKVGGAAEAYGQTFAGKLQIFSSEWENVKEQIGSAILPILTDLLNAAQPLIVAFGTDLTGAAEGLSGAIGAASPILSDVGTILSNLVEGAVTLGGAFISGVYPAFQAIGQAIGPVGPSLKDVESAFSGLASQTGKLSSLTPVAKELGTTVGNDLVKGFGNLETIWKAISPTVTTLAEGIGGALLGAGKALAPVVGDAFAAIFQFDQEISQRSMPIIKELAEGFEIAMPIIEAIWTAVWPYLQAELEGFWDIIQGVVQVAWSILTGLFKVGLDLLSGNWKGAWADIQDTFSGVVAGLEKIGSGFMKIVEAEWEAGWAAIKSWFNTTVGDAETLGQNIIKGLGNGMGAMAGWLKQEAADLAQDALNAIKGALGIHSPSKVLAEVGQNTSIGFVQGMTNIDVAGAAGQHFGKVANAAAVGVNGSGSSQSAARAFTGNSGHGGSGNGVNLAVTLELDGLSIWQAVAPHAVDDIRLKTGATQ